MQGPFHKLCVIILQDSSIFGQYCLSPLRFIYLQYHNSSTYQEDDYIFHIFHSNIVFKTINLNFYTSCKFQGKLKKIKYSFFISYDLMCIIQKILYNVYN